VSANPVGIRILCICMSFIIAHQERMFLFIHLFPLLITSCLVITIMPANNSECSCPCSHKKLPNITT